MASNRHVYIRAANAEIAGTARQSLWDRSTPVPFLCECDNVYCQAHVRMTLPDFEAKALEDYVVAPGHAIDRPRAAA